MLENWKDIVAHPDYMISDLGNVKSLKGGKEKILKPGVGTDGYLVVNLSNNNKQKTCQVHKLVSIAFLNHQPCGYELVINHKNFVKTDNRVSNLEIVTPRENTDKKHLKSTSNLVGVCFYEQTKKWKASISVNGKQKHLGYFKNENEASNAYQNSLNQILCCTAV